jgi:hypothetical protein
MECRDPIDTDALIEEIGRYLLAVDLFRALDSDPTWCAEHAQLASRPPSSVSRWQPSDVGVH